MDEKYTVPTMGEHLATIREAIQVFESGAAHNTKMYRTVVAHDQQDRANRLRASLVELERLQAENAELLADQAEEDTLREKMAGFLRGVANALKGTPEDLHHHSWHDIVEIAVTRMYELTQAREMMLATHEANADLAAQVQETRKDADEWRNTAIATGTELATVRKELATYQAEQPAIWERSKALEEGIGQERDARVKAEEELDKLRAERATVKFSLMAPPADRMTEFKAMEIMLRTGMKKAGYVLQAESGQGGAAIVHLGAVHWLSDGELWQIVHPGAQS